MAEAEYSGKTAENFQNHNNDTAVQGKVEAPVTGAQSSTSPENKIPPFFGKPKTRTPKLLDLRMLDMRVGKVKEVVQSENDEEVYTLIINVKKAHKKTSSCSLLLATGFDPFDLIDTKVVTVLNGPVTLLADDTECDIRVLAAVRMGGEEGKDVEAVEVLKPPKKAKTGYPIYAEGHVQEQYWSIKEKNYQIIMKDLMVNEDFQAIYRGVPLKVKDHDGYIKTKNLSDCGITHI